MSNTNQVHAETIQGLRIPSGDRRGSTVDRYGAYRSMFEQIGHRSTRKNLFNVQRRAEYPGGVLRGIETLSRTIVSGVARTGNGGR